MNHAGSLGGTLVQHISEAAQRTAPVEMSRISQRNVLDQVRQLYHLLMCSTRKAAKKIALSVSDSNRLNLGVCYPKNMGAKMHLALLA